MRPDRSPGRVRIGQCLCLVLVLLATMPASRAGADATVTLKLRDAGSGAPTDARLRIVNGDGWAFAEPDQELLTHNWPSTGYYVHVADSLVMTGPAGPWMIRASRGITGIPVESRTDVAGSTIVVLELADWIDPRLDGWYGGDTHVHLFHDEGLNYDRVTEERAAIAARAEGLDLMYLLENDALHPGGPVQPAQPGVALVWGEEYRNSFWGHTVWLGLGELVWYPYSGAGCCGTVFPAWPTLANTFAERDTGVRILAHPRSTDDPLVHFDGWPGSGYARERAALALGDQLHGFAVASASNEGEVWALEDYLDALRSGARWAAVGEGDRALDRYLVSPPGSPRTYAWLGPGWSAGSPGFSAAWEAAVRDRRCFATTGPIIRDFRIGERRMGDEVVASGSVDVSFSVAAYRPIERITLHGATGTHLELAPGTTEYEAMVTVEIGHDDFVLLEVEASGAGWLELAHPPRAVSSPVWIEAGSPWPVQPGLARRNADALEQFFAQAIETRGFDDPADSLAAWQDIVGASRVYEGMFDDPPAAFSLIAPEDGAEIAGSTVVFEWGESISYDDEPVSYRLIAATDAGFTDVLADVVTLQTRLELAGFSGSTAIFWRVEAIEPGEAPTLASAAPRHLFLSGPAVAAPAITGGALEVLATRTDATGLSLAIRVADPMDVVVSWVDVRGRVVGRQRLGRLPRGESERLLPMQDREGHTLARGVYWLVAESGPHRDVRRIVWLR